MKPVAQASLTPKILAEVVEQFHLEHERSYGYCSRTERVQLVNLRLRARGLDRQERLPSISALRTGAQVVRKSEHGWITAPVLRRGDLTGEPVQGPLIVEEYDTTIIVPPEGAIHAVSGTVRIRLNGAG